MCHVQLANIVIVPVLMVPGVICLIVGAGEGESGGRGERDSSGGGAGRARLG